MCVLCRSLPRKTGTASSSPDVAKSNPRIRKRMSSLHWPINHLIPITEFWINVPMKGWRKTKQRLHPCLLQVLALILFGRTWNTEFALSIGLVFWHTKNLVDYRCIHLRAEPVCSFLLDVPPRTNSMTCTLTDGRRFFVEAGTMSSTKNNSGDRANASKARVKESSGSCVCVCVCVCWTVSER